MLDIQIAVAKTNKYATPESGDTVEVVERPNGGFSVVLADGQGSGRAAKSLSHMVTTKAVSLIKDGVRDGAVARAAHDYLYASRGGKVSVTLAIVSVDLATRTLVLSRNSHCPVLLWHAERGLEAFDTPSNSIGIYHKTKPEICELPLEPNLYAVTFSDGLMEAGKRDGRGIDLPSLINTHLAQGAPTAHALADSLLEEALTLDASRPADDMTVLVVAILPLDDVESTRIVPQVRRMELRVPVA
jgi:serine phosphatase RsbU (regulator of sigma subunit)